MVQVGITSWGIGCGAEGVPGVYSDVRLFTSWVQEAMDTLLKDNILTRNKKLGGRG